MPRMPDDGTRKLPAGVTFGGRTPGTRRVPDSGQGVTLGDRPTPRRTRGLPDTSRAGAGLQRASGALLRYADNAGALAGIGADVAEALHVRSQEDAYAQAVSQWSVGLMEIDERFSEDRDWATLQERYAQAVDGLRESLGQNLGGPWQRRFETLTTQQAVEAVAGMGRYAVQGRQDATRAWLVTTLEESRRAYLDAANNPTRVNALHGAQAAIRSAEASGAIDHETAERQWLTFRQKSATDRVSMMPDAEQLVVLRSENALSGNIDPADRARMIRQAETRLAATTGVAVRDAITVLNAGKVPADLAAVEAMAAGTEFAPVLQEAIEDREAVQAFMALPVAVQADHVTEFAQRETATAREVVLNERLARTYAATVTAIGSGHGLAAARDAGVIEGLSPLSFDDAGSLRVRQEQALVASAWAGQPVGPLAPGESDALEAAIDSATDGAVVGLLGTLYEGLGPFQAIALAGQVASDRPELAAAIVLARDDPTTARDIVLGGRLLRQHTDVVPSKVERFGAIDAVIGNMFDGTPAGALAMEGFVQAGIALYANRRVPGGDLSYDQDTFEEALSDAMGGVVEFNGRNILPPVPGMSEDDVEDHMEALTDDDLIVYGNGIPVFLDGSPFMVEMFDRWGTDAQLVPSGFGTYLVYMDGLGFAITDRGGAYEFDFRSMLLSR